MGAKRRLEDTADEGQDTLLATQAPAHKAIKEEGSSEKRHKKVWMDVLVAVVIETSCGCADMLCVEEKGQGEQIIIVIVVVVVTFLLFRIAVGPWIPSQESLPADRGIAELAELGARPCFAWRGRACHINAQHRQDRRA